MTERLLRHGLESLDDAESLALLTGLSAAGAQRLLDAFGSLPEVFGAAAPDIARLGGAAAAARVKLAQGLAVRLLAAPLRRRAVLSSWSLVADYLRMRLTGAPREQFRVLYLDRRNRLIADEVMGEGTVNHAPVYVREVIRRALELSASALILAHNHPAQDPTPSAADIDMTLQIVAAASVLGLAVHDHLIVAGQEVTSLKRLGVL